MNQTSINQILSSCFILIVPSPISFICLTVIFIPSSTNQYQSVIGIAFNYICLIILYIYYFNTILIIYTIINQSSIHQSNIDIHFHTSDYTIRLIILHLYHIHHHQSKIGVQFHTSDYTIPSLFSFIRLIYIYIYIYMSDYIHLIPF